MNTLRAAVIGAGYLGRFHAQKYAALGDVDLVAVVDRDPARAREVADALGVPAHTDYRAILDGVDLVSIVVPTECHHRVASDCLRAGVHILLEKPVTQTVAEAQDLVDTAEACKLVFQVGHLERFNPAILALQGVLGDPMFIESHRLTPFRGRGTDVNVVMDLMIHDIDIILNMVPSDISAISAVGVPVLSPEVDIANARLEFANGCVANVTASRVSRDAMRKIRVFQQNTYISIDYNARTISIFRKDAEQTDAQGLPKMNTEEKSFEQADTLLCEIRAFVDAVKEGTPPLVSGRDGKRALEIALRITEDINNGKA